MCSRDTSASSAVGVLNDNACAIQIHALNHSHTLHSRDESGLTQCLGAATLMQYRPSALGDAGNQTLQVIIVR